MRFFSASLRRYAVARVVCPVVLALSMVFVFDAVGQIPQATQPSSPAPAPVSKYDKAIFQKPIPADQLNFLNQFAGVPTKDAFRDKELHKLMKSVVPDCMFHYGRDMPLMDALELIFKDSPEQVLVRDGRYVLLSGYGQILAGRGFLWFDMKDGIAVGGFFFHPINGEPTPSLNIFSRQIVKEDVLSLHQLPPAFIDDLVQWATESRVPPLTTRYFLTGSNKKILLEHDEDFCTLADGSPASADSHCEEMAADAADIDMNAASYLDQAHHATNATAWTINNPDQVAWLQIRTSTCGPGTGQLSCRIRMTRERTNVIIHRGGGSAPHPHR